MKYKFFLSYTYNVYKGTETIEEGEIVEIIRFRESVGEKFVDCLRSNEKYFRISLEALKFCAEEYHETTKPKFCVRCKNFIKCREYAEKNFVFLGLGDFCARFEEGNIEENRKWFDKHLEENYNI